MRSLAEIGRRLDALSAGEPAPENAAEYLALGEEVIEHWVTARGKVRPQASVHARGIHIFCIDSAVREKLLAHPDTTHVQAFQNLGFIATTGNEFSAAATNIDHQRITR